jgi:hypothetical protein
MAFFEKPVLELFYEPSDSLDREPAYNHYKVRLCSHSGLLDRIFHMERHYNLAMIVGHIFDKVVLLCGIFVLLYKKIF